MAGNYKSYISLAKRLYSVGSPVLIENADILKNMRNGELNAEFVFLNVCDKTVKELVLSVLPLNSAGSPCGEASEFVYSELWVSRDMSFGAGMMIPLGVKDMVSADFLISSVIFTDGSSLSLSRAKWLKLPKQVSLEEHYGNKVMVSEYQLIFGSESDYFPLSASDLWLCTCGFINRDNENKCHSCNKSKELLFNMTEERLSEKLQERLKREKAEKPKFNEFYEAVVKDEKKRRRRLVIYIMILAVIITFIALLISMDHDHYTAVIKADVDIETMEL